MIEYLKNNFTLSITLLTFFGYSSAYMYEFGVCNYYNIPPAYISITLGNLLTPTLTGVIIFQYLLMSINHITYINKTTATVFDKSAIYICMVLIVIAIGLPLILTISRLLAITCMVILVASMFFSVKIMTKYERPVINPSSQTILTLNSGKITLPRLSIFAVVDRVTIGFIAYFLLFLFIVRGFGYVQSAKRNSYPRISTHKTLVVVSQYGDKAICKSFNFQTKRWGDSIVVLKNDELKFRTDISIR